MFVMLSAVPSSNFLGLLKFLVVFGFLGKGAR
jgi:hypothetical protein